MLFSVDNYFLTFMQMVIFVTNREKDLSTCDFLFDFSFFVL